MYCAVILKEFCENVLIPIEWVKDLTPSMVLTDGFKTHSTYIVFYDGNHIVSEEEDISADVAPADVVADDVPVPDFNDVEIIHDGEFRHATTVGYFDAYINACFGKLNCVLNFIYRVTDR